jgi:hypothetical protein
VTKAVAKATEKIKKTVAKAKASRSAAKAAPAKRPAARPAPSAPRPRKPLGGIADSAFQGDDYEPQQTSTHAPFRNTSGGERSIDEQLPAEMTTNEQFSDEDHYTNHSGDPRIGTHNRSYEAPAATSSEGDEDDTPEI